mmetsp:Transcript_26466/g.37139  ORF Transcript_26466/g.37139 Transcript_26466/m.37139 type:complete len:426 (-) Transcript_26466:114-1391(-)
MLNRFSTRWPLWLAAFVFFASTLADSADFAGDCAAPREEGEVTELLQSARGSATRRQNETASSTVAELHTQPRGDLHAARNGALQAALMELQRRTTGRDDSDSGMILLGVVVLLGLIFLVITVCFARSCSSVEKSKAAPDIAFVQPSAALREEALPAICRKFLANTRDQPFTVLLAPLREDKVDWTLDVLSNWSHQAILRVCLCRGATKLEGALAMRRSCLQVRSFGGEKYKDVLLGSINSLLEIFLPDGRKFGQLLPSDGGHILHEESGREPRYSLGMENPSTISAVWLSRGGSPECHDPDADQLQDGLIKMGGQALRHSRKGSVLGTVARPEGSNGDRLELMNVPGTDAVLQLLIAFGLVIFDGALDVVNASQFQQEKTGLGWVSMPPAESETPTARNSLSTAGAAVYDRARNSLAAGSTVCT